MAYRSVRGEPLDLSPAMYKEYNSKTYTDQVWILKESQTFFIQPNLYQSMFGKVINGIVPFAFPI